MRIILIPVLVVSAHVSKNCDTSVAIPWKNVFVEATRYAALISRQVGDRYCLIVSALLHCFNASFFHCFSAISSIHLLGQIIVVFQDFFQERFIVFKTLDMQDRFNFAGQLIECHQVAF